MPMDTLTGSRIRERRIMLGIKQAILARDAGVSASYLNLIEHNRRRIGGKLLNNIAELLGVEPATLTEGAGAALIATLREVAADADGTEVELDRVDEFAGRFPGWAQLLADSHRRIAGLERTVETLNDRMTHDPHLATSLHEMLSTVTAIRSAASILAEPGEIAPEWQARFHRNIYEDSGRLAETSRGLVTYLEADGEVTTEIGSPQEEFDEILGRVEHRNDILEDGGSVEDALTSLSDGVSGVGQALLRRWLSRYESDARALPLGAFGDAVVELGPDVAALAQRFAVPPGQIMRRLAALPHDILPDPVGLAICDASGALTYRKPLPDFPMPRFGAACPLWPLYRSLNRPMMILSMPVAQGGRGAAQLWADAAAQPQGGWQVNADPVYEAHMLIRRALPGGGEITEEVAELGVACRICTKSNCHARSEPSILSVQR